MPGSARRSTTQHGISLQLYLRRRKIIALRKIFGESKHYNFYFGELCSNARRFYVYISLDESLCLQRNESPPSAGRLKLFMEWIFDTTVGSLTKCMTLKALKNRWYAFRAMYHRETYNLISKDVGEDVLNVRIILNSRFFFLYIFLVHQDNTQRKRSIYCTQRKAGSRPTGCRLALDVFMVLRRF
jgi:hypothetical protein